MNKNEFIALSLICSVGVGILIPTISFYSGELKNIQLLLWMNNLAWGIVANVCIVKLGKCLKRKSDAKKVPLINSIYGIAVFFQKGENQFYTLVRNELAEKVKAGVIVIGQRVIIYSHITKMWEPCGIVTGVVAVSYKEWVEKTDNIDDELISVERVRF